MEDATRKVMGRLNPNFTNFATPVKSLSGGQRQAVAIARAVYFNARILIMDEPTAALGPAETAQVRDLIRQLKDEGIGIFLISHDIHDVFDLSDRISVMYHGRIVDTVDKAKRHAGRRAGHDHPGQEARRGDREGQGGHRAARLTRARGHRPRGQPARRAERSAPAPGTARGTRACALGVPCRVGAGRRDRRGRDQRVGGRLDASGTSRRRPPPAGPPRRPRPRSC